MEIEFVTDDLSDVDRSTHLDCPLDDSFGSRDTMARGGDQVVNLDGASAN